MFLGASIGGCEVATEGDDSQGLLVPSKNWETHDYTTGAERIRSFQSKCSSISS